MISSELPRITVVERMMHTPDFLTYILVCTAQSTWSMKTNDIPLKSPIKLQKEMQKKFEFSKIC